MRCGGRPRLVWGRPLFVGEEHVLADDRRLCGDPQHPAVGLGVYLDADPESGV